MSTQAHNIPRSLARPPDAHHQTSRRYLFAISALVLCFLYAPLVVSIVNIARKTGTPREERHAPTPTFPRSPQDVAPFLKKAKWYFIERFGLKHSLVTLYGLLKVNCLGGSSSSAVLLGRDGWLFLASENVLEYHRGADPLGEREVHSWVTTLDKRRQWLANRNVRHAVVVAPNSHTIYEEFLPDNLAKRGRTRLDQMNEAIRVLAPAVTWIDLTPALLGRKDDVQLFFKTDTHWTPAGAFVGTRAVAERLGLTPPMGETLPTRSRKIGGGDLARLLGLAQRMGDTEVWPAAVPLHLLDDAGQQLALGFTDVVTSPRLVVLNPNASGTALVYRDSFGEAMIPWLSALFGKTVWLSSYEFSEEAVLAEQPDIVIEQIVERKLWTLNYPGGGLVD
jgi:alginate O-acetyltransferase complex protein AlgJ